MKYRRLATLNLLLLSLGLPLHAQTPTNPTPIPSGAEMRPSALPKLATDRLMLSASPLTYATHAPQDATRLFLLEQRGRVLIFDLDTLAVNAVPFLDIDSLVIDGGGQRGLFGVAFHPDYQTNGLFYVNYDRNGDGDVIVAEYLVTADPDVADVGSARIVLTVDQPSTTHKGGWMDFSPLDGFLYIATGDGGDRCDAGPGHTAGIGNAQDVTDNLLGKMLRIDPLGGPPYGVPASNPFVGVLGDDEIWSYGLRSPWRASFDRLTGDLFIADVGQDLREEVNFQSAASVGGENYGWRCREGNGCAASLPSGCPDTTGCICSQSMASLSAPIHDYEHLSPPPPASNVCCVIGGYAYRGSAFPHIQGHYFFADLCGSAIWSFRVENGSKVDFRDWTDKLSPSLDGFPVNVIVSFGEDANGELYIVTYFEVFKIVPR